MPIVDVGRDQIVALVIGEAGAKVWGSGAYLGVGDGTTAFAKSDTDIVGTNKTYKPMKAGSPTRIGNTATWVADFGTADGNHDWWNVGVFSGAMPGGTMFARYKPASLIMTKSSAVSATLTYQHTVSN